MDASPPGAAPDRTYRQQYLFAFVPQGELVSHVRSEALPAEAARLPAILEAWKGLQPRVEEIARREAGEADRVEVQPLPAEIADQVAGYAAAPQFRPGVWKLPIRFGMVEVDRLVAAQRHVNLDFVEALAARLPPRPTPSEVAAVCLAPQSQPDAVRHLELAAHTHAFSSANSDLRFLGSFQRPARARDGDLLPAGGVPAAALVSFIGYGSAGVNVFEAGGRIVLANGFHRVFALRRLGVRRVPAVIQMVRDPELEFPPAVVQLPREYLLQAPRPVLMRDFLDPAYSIELRIRARFKMVLVDIQLGQHDLPT